ncbi:hypothetical protein ACT2CV_06710 [Pasteurellaceae bacterium 22721_9_1]
MSFNRKYVLFLASFILFVLVFQFNFFKTVSRDWFNYHQRDSEALVISKILESERNGLFSHMGFMGNYTEGPKNIGYIDNAPYNIPINGKYGVYSSSFGLQGIFYSLLDQTQQKLGVESPELRLFYNKLFTSILSALLFSIIALFFYQYFGIISSLTYLVTMIFSGWLIVFANNLYWMLFLIYLPCIVTAYFSVREDKTGKWNTYTVCGFTFLAVFIKCLAGYEYISTILITMLIPLVFFSIKNSLRLNEFISRSLKISFAGVIGFLFALAIHFTQLMYYSGGFKNAKAVLMSIILKRTHGNPDDFTYNATLAYSLKTDLFSVLVLYIKKQLVFGVSAGSIILGVLIISLLNVVLMRTHPLKKNNYAFLASLWLSLLAPLSWYILAKGHSHIHHHINYLLWYVPFLLLVSAYIGYSFQFYWGFVQKRPKLFITIIVSILLFAIPVYIYKLYNFKKDLITQSTHLVSVPERDLDIYISENKLLYVSRTCDSNIEDRFFLHISPVDNTYLDKMQIKRGATFNNFDFNWYQAEKIKADPLLKSLFSQTIFLKNNVCIAVKDLPFYPIKSIKTGQYAQYKGGLIYWDRDINISKFLLIPEIELIDLSDSNWEKSVHRVDNAFFIKNTFDVRNAIKVNTVLKFNDDEERMVTHLKYSKNYINIYVNGTKLNPHLTGYPNKVKIVR